MGANAQTSVPAFTAGQVLTAAQVTQINTGIPVFASSTERDAAFGGTGEKTLAEGQYAFLEDTNETLVYDGSGWVSTGGKILQVVTDYDTSTFSTSSTSFVATNASVTLTPTSATSKVFLIASIYISRNTGASDNYFSIDRDGTTITAEARFTSNPGNQRHNVAFVYLDSPASASALTYTLEMRVGANTGYAEGAHSITAFEVSA